MAELTRAKPKFGYVPEPGVPWPLHTGLEEKFLLFEDYVNEPILQYREYLFPYNEVYLEVRLASVYYEYPLFLYSAKVTWHSDPARTLIPFCSNLSSSLIRKLAYICAAASGPKDPIWESVVI